MAENKVAQDSKKAIKLAATLVFNDESAISLSPVIMRTWSPACQTPIIKVKTRSLHKISTIGCGAAAPKCKRVRMLFRIHPGNNVKAPDCISFFEQLKQNIKTPITVIWDQLHAHRSRKIQNYLDRQRRRIQIKFFPSYAPDLNPIEYGWIYLKTISISQFTPRRL